MPPRLITEVDPGLDRMLPMWTAAFEEPPENFAPVYQGFAPSQRRHIALMDDDALLSSVMVFAFEVARGDGATYRVGGVGNVATPHAHRGKGHSGELGALRSLQMTRFGAFPKWSSDGWLGKEERSGSAALDLHIHDTDYVSHLLGDPQDMRSRGSRNATGLARVFSTLEYPDALVQTEGGWDLPDGAPFRMSFRAVFENGALFWDGGPLTKYRDGEKRDGEKVEITDLGAMSAGEQGGNVSDLGGYYAEMKYFYDCLREDRQVERCSPASSRDSLRLTLREIAEANGAQGVAC